MGCHQGQEQRERRVRQGHGAVRRVPLGRALVLGIDEHRHTANFCRRQQASPPCRQKQLPSQPFSLHSVLSTANRPNRKTGTSWRARPFRMISGTRA